MGNMIESMLYVDEQALPPEGFCEDCGRELYGPTMTCLHCERSNP